MTKIQSNIQVKRGVKKKRNSWAGMKGCNQDCYNKAFFQTLITSQCRKCGASDIPG